jgi:hypothetical protein
MSLKESWENIVKKVNSSPVLSEAEKKNVLNAADKTIGENLIEESYPIKKGSLTENEFSVYKKILTSLNEGEFKPIKTDGEYARVVKTIVKQNPDKATKNLLVKMDLAHQDGNWKDVNFFLKKISENL